MRMKWVTLVIGVLVTGVWGPELWAKDTAKPHAVDIDSILNFFSAPISNGMAAFFTAAFAVLGTGFGKWLHGVSIQRRLNSDVRIRKGDKKNSVMLIGLGGVGKSTLAKRIQNNFSGDGTQKTDEYNELSAYWKDTIGKQNYHIYVSDYKGQSLTTQISGFIEQQKSTDTKFRFGFINSLVLIVDIIPPKKGEDDINPEDLLSVKSYDKERIEEHLIEWNKTALDAVFGMHDRESLRYICLYINKINRLSEINDTVRKEILTAFKPLIDDLKTRCSYKVEDFDMPVPFARFECYVDDAHNGPSAAFKEDLMRFSVPLSKEAKSEIGADGA